MAAARTTADQGSVGRCIKGHVRIEFLLDQKAMQEIAEGFLDGIVLPIHGLLADAPHPRFIGHISVLQQFISSPDLLRMFEDRLRCRQRSVGLLGELRGEPTIHHPHQDTLQQGHDQDRRQENLGLKMDARTERHGRISIEASP